jgi:dTDP-glucose 4,6-dehydratase
VTWKPQRVVVTGGAGFLGSHLIDRLLADGAEVVCVDNFITGSELNLGHHAGNARLSVVRQDVTAPWGIDGPVDAIFHLAALASPVDYGRYPLESLEVGTAGTLRALRVATDKGARFLLASSSEVYGDPLVHPQPESYWGNVNPIGPRSVYDEAKRTSEAFSAAFQAVHGADVRIARIFNTYGPRMRRSDGRAVPQFMTQALRGEPLTVYGNGSQTRSLCYVDDLIEGIMRLAESSYAYPINLGNPQEVTVMDLAILIRDVCGSSSPIELRPLPVDDPQRRCPDVGLATGLLGWNAMISLDSGLRRTAAWWRSQGQLSDGGES